MDFVLDPSVSVEKPANNSSETLTLGNSSDSKPTDAKTEEEFGKLEKGIEDTYNLVQKATFGWGASLSGFVNKIGLPETLTETQKKLGSLTGDVVAQSKKLAEKGSLQINEISKGFSEETPIENHTEGSSSAAGPKKMLDLLSSATSDYLDGLDHELEQVENFSISYANKVGTFIKKNLLEGDGSAAAAAARDKQIDAANKGDLDPEEATILFNVPDDSKTQIYATRTEAQLNALRTSQDLYVTNALDAQYDAFAAKMDLASKTEEISSLLQSYPQLQNLMASLVPAKVSYDEFWTRYFFMHAEIIAQEEKRKKLLQNDDDEDFDWDDDDDDNAGASGAKDDDDSKLKEPAKPAGSRTSSEITYDLKSTNSSTLDVVASKRAKEKKEEEYDDDDWE